MFEPNIRAHRPSRNDALAMQSAYLYLKVRTYFRLDVAAGKRTLYRFYPRVLSLLIHTHGRLSFV